MGQDAPQDPRQQGLHGILFRRREDIDEAVHNSRGAVRKVTCIGLDDPVMHSEGEGRSVGSLVEEDTGFGFNTLPEAAFLSTVRCSTLPSAPLLDHEQDPVVLQENPDADTR